LFVQPSSEVNAAQSEVSKLAEKETTKKAELLVAEQNAFSLFSNPVSEPVPALVSTGWGSDFLKKNAETAAAAKEAIEKEVQKDAEPDAKPPSAIFGMPSGVVEAKEDKVQPPQAAVASASTGWGSDFLKKNAETAAAAKEAIEKEVQKDAEPGVKPPSAIFGMPSGVVEAKEDKVQPPQAAVASASTGWGSDFLKKNAETAAAAKEAIEKEVQKDVEPDVKPPSATFGSSSAVEIKSSKEDHQPQKTSENQKQGMGEMRPISILAPSPDLASIGSQPDMAKHQDNKESKFPFSIPAATGFGDSTASAGFSIGGITGTDHKEKAQHAAFVFGAQHASSEPEKSSKQVRSEDVQKTGFDSQPAQVSSFPIEAPPASSSGATFGITTPSFDFGASSSQSSKPFVFGASSSGSAAGFGATGSIQQPTQTVNATSTGTMQFGAAPMNSLSTSGTGIGTGSNFSGFGGNSGSGEPKFSFSPVTQDIPAFGAAQPSAGASAAGFTSQQQAPSGGFASGFGMSEQPVANGPFGTSSSSAMWNASGPASFTPSFNQAPTNAGFGAPSSGFGGFAAGPNAFNSQNTFGTQTTGGFGSSMGGFGTSPFPQPSAPGQMIPNDNPFGGGLPSAGGFSLGSTGNSQSEGRRKVKVKRRNRN
jgi:hypothetical protein